MRTLTVDATLGERWRAIGFDASAMGSGYPAEILKAVIEAACAHLFPELRHEDGRRRLGRLTAEGFPHTEVGSVYAALAASIATERLVSALPRFISAARPDATVRINFEGERRWRAFLEMPFAIPPFSAGIVERLIERTGVSPTVEVENVLGDAFELCIRW